MCVGSVEICRRIYVGRCPEATGVLLTTEYAKPCMAGLDRKHSLGSDLHLADIRFKCLHSDTSNF